MISSGRIRSIASRFQFWQSSRALGERRLSIHLYSSEPAVLRFFSGSVDVGDKTNEGIDTISGSSSDLYLHVGPSGDFWTGHSIFAAKHLQPDYVKSLRLDVRTMDVDLLLELLEENDGDGEWARIMYDEGIFPQDLLDRLQKESSSSSKQE